MEFKIFLSHHETETEIAQGIRRFLESTSNQIKVETFVDKANRDADFRRWISNAISGSQLFVFLYADDAREGKFWAAMYRVVDLRRPLCEDKQGHVMGQRSRDIQGIWR